MPTIHLRFPGGRYHATPGGHHVNEGQIEWPPSPWRILRALIATGYNTLGWQEVPGSAVSLLEKLASVLPSFSLPAASAAHSRHYMPLGKLDKGREKTALVFDAWADIGRGVMAVSWDVALTDAERELLAVLVGRLGYLGRSESWVEAEIVADDTPEPTGHRAVSCNDHACPGPSYEQIAVTAPVNPAAFRDWREGLIAEALEPFPLPEGSKKPSKRLLTDRSKAQAPFPKSLVDALQWDTARWKDHRWGQAPGSRRVLYWRRANSLEVSTVPPRREQTLPQVECMLLALATGSRNRSALPIVARTLPQADLLHDALVSRAGGGERVHCPELTGTDEDGKPMRGHRHARILPLDLDGDGHLDHVLIHARMGLGAYAQCAIRSLRRTWQKKGQDLQVVVVGAGALDDLRGLPQQLRVGVNRVLGPPGGARTWESSTPFVPPLFLKRRGANDLQGQVLKELEHHGLPPAQVEVLGWNTENASLRHAVRVRSGDSKPPPVNCGYAIRLVFDEPIRGPICLGYASHYGLGLFGAV